MLLLIVIGLQFIQPEPNKTGKVSASGFTETFTVPGNIQAILKDACYDCHSNNTSYPWYARIQPVAWILANHIKEGKAELNFSDFGSLGKRRQVSKLRAIASQVKENEMPISSYKLMHKKARLTAGEKMLLINWMTHTADSLLSNNGINQ